MEFELIKKFANDLAQIYVQQRQPVLDKLLSFCQENNLNPEQVRTLVQLINTLIHLMLFESKTDDKIIEFEPIDPEVCVSKLFKELPVETPLDDQETVSVDLFDDLSPLMRTLKNRLNGGTQRTIDLSDVFGPGVAQVKEEKTPTGYRKQMLIMKVQKTAEELKQRSLMAAANYCDFVDLLATKFASLYGPDFDEFVKEAYALRGAKAQPIITDLCRCLKRDTPKMEKRASQIVVDTSKEEFQLLDEMIKLHDEFTTTKLAWEKLEDALNQL